MNLTDGILTVNTAGIYIVTASGDWQADSGATGRRLWHILLEGSNSAADERSDVGNDNVGTTCSVVFEVAATDEIKVNCYQNSGGNLNLQTGTMTNMSIARIG